MIYGFGGRVDNDSNAITIIDEENRTAETKGYVNGEYVEFSGSEGGYLGLHTATVSITYDTSEIEGDVAAIESGYVYLGYDVNFSNYAINFNYNNEKGLPITELGTPTQMHIPISDDYPAFINIGDFTLLDASSGALTMSDISIVSGDATQTEYGISITGDCSLNIKVQYQD